MKIDKKKIAKALGALRLGKTTLTRKEKDKIFKKIAAPVGPHDREAEFEFLSRSEKIDRLKSTLSICQVEMDIIYSEIEQLNIKRSNCARTIADIKAEIEQLGHGYVQGELF